MGHKQEHQQKELMDIARDFDVAMLCTVARDGSIHARPMIVAEIDDQGCFWFITSRRAGKVEEIEGDAHAAVTFQGRKSFASLSGRARLADDERSAGAVWRRALRAWFPQGPDDPDVALLCFEPAAGEHWEHGLLDAAKIRIDQARAKVAARGAKDTKGAKAHAHDRVPLEHRR